MLKKKVAKHKAASSIPATKKAVKKLPVKKAPTKKKTAKKPIIKDGDDVTIAVPDNIVQDNSSSFEIPQIVRPYGTTTFKFVKPKPNTEFIAGKKKTNGLRKVTEAQDSRLLDFLDSFGHRHIYLYNKNCTSVANQEFEHTDVLDNVLNNNSDKEADAYFYINGKRKIADVSKCFAFFVDLDAGRNPTTGKYLTVNQVNVFKHRAINTLNSFGISPSWVVDTRNGYQCYWILDKPLEDLNLWNGIQKKIVNYFSAVGSDLRAIKPNQIYRLPYTVWHKKWEGQNKHLTSILSESRGHSISVEQMELALIGETTTITKAQIQNAVVQSSDYWKNLKNNKGPALAPLPIPSTSTTAPELAKQKSDILQLTVQFLAQVQNPLHYSGNKFLASSAKMLEEQIKQFYSI